MICIKFDQKNILKTLKT